MKPKPIKHPLVSSYPWRRQRDLQALKKRVDAEVQQRVQAAIAQLLEQSRLRSQGLAAHGLPPCN
jgi:hypothetical protein